MESLFRKICGSRNFFCPCDVVVFLPICVFIFGSVSILWNFLCALVITKDSHPYPLPAISDVSGKYPESWIFAFFMNMSGWCFIIISYRRFQILMKKRLPLCVNIPFFLLALLSGWSLCGVSIVSMFELLVLHGILALTFFVSILFVVYTWVFQDCWMILCKERCHDKVTFPNILFLVIRSVIGFFGTIFVTGMIACAIALPIMKASKKKNQKSIDICVSFMNVMEWTYVGLMMFFIASTTYDISKYSERICGFGKDEVVEEKGGSLSKKRVDYESMENLDEATDEHDIINVSGDLEKAHLLSSKKQRND